MAATVFEPESTATLSDEAAPTPAPPCLSAVLQDAAPRSAGVLWVGRRLRRGELLDRLAADRRWRLVGLRSVPGQMPRLAEFDLVVASGLLYRGGQPEALLQRLWACLREGGSLVVIDRDTTALRSLPPQPAVERAIRLLHAAHRREGCDLEAGTRAGELLLAAGLGEPQCSEVSSTVTPLAPAVRMLRGELREALPAVRRHQLAPAAELARLRADLDAAAREPGTVRWADSVVTRVRKGS
jgi:hypothetical protein